jgi:type IV pilus assembly protein PilX
VFTDHSNSLLHRKRAGGMALFISLILLLMLTIVGVSAVQTTTLEVRMARNEHDSMLAFQAAESALRDGEAVVAALEATDNFVDAGVNGLWTAAAMGEPHRWTLDGVWAQRRNTSVAAPTAIGRVAGQPQPRFIIEYLTEVPRDAVAFASGDPYESAAGERIEMFRITARGVGATEQSVVMLQSTYGRPAGSWVAREDWQLDARLGRQSWRELN